METRSFNNHCEKLILVFAGWGVDEKVFSHLTTQNYDVIILFNYTEFKLKECSQLHCTVGVLHQHCPVYRIFDQYKEINIIAWGVGVWAATVQFGNYLNHLEPVSKFKTLRLLRKIKKTVAINGTLCPISNIWGIQQDVFDNMIVNLETDVKNKCTCETSNHLHQFNLKTCGQQTVYEQYKTIAPQRGLEDILNELKSIRDHFVFNNTIFWSKTIIANQDIIIPAKNQIRFWSEYKLGVDWPNKRNFNLHDFSIEYIDAPHYPFFQWKKWDEIIR